MVSITLFALIFLLTLGCSKASTIVSRSCSVVLGIETFFKRWRATGPPTKPPNTNPSVAQAIANSTAPVTPYLSARIGPHAPALPWPPVRVIEPAIKPINGLSFIMTAILMPTVFWMAIRIVTAIVNRTNGFPPLISREKSELSPIEEKNVSINKLCNEASKVNE